MFEMKFENVKCVCVCVSNLGGDESKMTERERDEIDADAELYIKTCVSAIQQLRTQGQSAVSSV